MKYLRTPEDITTFCQENEIEQISMTAITKAIEETHSLTQLGYFHSVFKDGFATYRQRGGNVEKQNEFAASQEVLDFIVNSGIFADVTCVYPRADKENVLNMYDGKIVKLFGRMEKGQVVELFGFNTGNYFETSFIKYSDQKERRSLDLWF